MHNVFLMSFMMFVASMLSTMNVFVDKLDDVRWSLNDVYMAGLMTGWMIIFMGIHDKNTKTILVGSILVAISFVCIRSQFGITQKQYINGMIPHHSMAVFMSKKILENKNINPELRSLGNDIILTQNKELKQFSSIK